MADVFLNDPDVGAEILSMSVEEIFARSKLIESEIHVRFLRVFMHVHWSFIFLYRS